MFVYLWYLMFVHLYVCVCLCMNMHVFCMCVFLCLCLCINMHVLCVCMYVCMCVCVFVCMHVLVMCTGVCLIYTGPWQSFTKLNFFLYADFLIFFGHCGHVLEATFFSYFLILSLLPFLISPSLSSIPSCSSDQFSVLLRQKLHVSFS